MTTDIKNIREELLQIIKTKGYFREKITLSSGKQSDYYIDARRVTLSAKGAMLSAQMILADVAKDKFDAIGGPTLGADPMLGAIGVLSVQAGKPIDTFIIRKEPKAHGKKQQIEGPDLKPGSRVVIIDDVATTGKAFIQSIDVLTQNNIKVVKAICIVDRGEGAGEALAQKNVPFTALFHINEIHK